MIALQSVDKSLKKLLHSCIFEVKVFEFMLLLVNMKVSCFMLKKHICSRLKYLKIQFDRFSI